jgi:hypothetical protein
VFRDGKQHDGAGNPDVHCSLLDHYRLQAGGAATEGVARADMSR